MRSSLAALLLLLLLPLSVRAQEGMANLIADSVQITREGALSARGNVVAWFDGYRLEARAILYDPATESLTIEGPLLITTPEGVILAADAATLDRGFRNALLSGARLVLDRQLQLAASRISRIDGRYNALDQATVTSCSVCTGRAPLWEIRAKRVIHDQTERQLYFDDARLLVRGVPVLWLPSLRLPDPSLDRSAGFLVPKVKTTDQLGFGLRIPYFLPLGPSRDLTLSPWLSPETRTLEFRYRQAFDRGDMTIEGALGRDTIRPGEWRGYLMANGAFDLGQNVVLGFDIESVSDRAFLFDYDISDQDRLASRLSLTRIGDDSLLLGRITYFESLREDERNASLPPFVGFLEWERRLSPAFGGSLTFGSSFEGFVRPETDPSREGRDMGRAGLSAEWRSNAVLSRGIVAETALRLAFDSYLVSDDPDSDSAVVRLVPQGAVTLRWPLLASGNSGTTYLLEPVASLGWAQNVGGAVPNEDSLLAEFDEGNLLALTRFPGADAVEEGLRAAFGINWNRSAADGSDIGLVFGRTLRSEAADFSATSGLSGLASDWLLAARIALPGGFRLDGRSLLDDAFTFGRTEGRIDWSNSRLSLGAAYVYLPTDPDEGRPATASEWTIDALYQVDDRWKIRADARYDVALNEPTRTGFGIGWRNECVTVDLSFSRRYTSNTFVEPSTSFGLSVNLDGFSTGRQAGVVTGSCG
jgi:LPS-assembly protein